MWCKMHYNIYEVFEMEKSATINVRLNPQLKKEAEEIMSGLGISMSTAIEIYLRQIVLRGGLPFDVVIPKGADDQIKS